MAATNSLCEGCSEEIVQTYTRGIVQRYCGECLPSKLRSKLADLKRKAKVKEIPFDLDLEYLVDLYNKADGCCQLTGIPFFSGDFEGYRGVHPFAASVDKIKPALGYTKGNVRLIIHQLNALIGEHGLELYEQIARAYLETKT